MMTTSMTVAVEITDDQLVAQSRDGNRDAFGRIVSRYQSLICSLAYSATGSLGQSEDLAQETFITAWKHLRHLRERSKLRAWLCGIARNRINNNLRREGREPLRDAEPLDSAHDSPALEPWPHGQTISNEEQAILWRSLERIPKIYREPLILFYREHQSIEAVAQNLELTPITAEIRWSIRVAVAAACAAERGQPCPREPTGGHSRTRLSALQFSGGSRLPMRAFYRCSQAVSIRSRSPDAARLGDSSGLPVAGRGAGTPAAGTGKCLSFSFSKQDEAICCYWQNFQTIHRCGKKSTIRPGDNIGGAD